MPNSLRRIRRLLIYMLISASLVFLGSHVVLSRHEGGSPERLMNIPTGGSAEYIDMAQHGPMAAPAPFRYRFLVPLVVSVLPVTAEQGFRIVTFTCLALTYLVALLLAEALGISLRGSLIALLSLFCARTHAFNYWNPLLTDGWALLASFLMTWALIRGRDVIFGAASVLGTLGRESVMFLTPAIFTRAEWKRAVMPSSLTIVAYVLPRVLLRTPDQDIVRFYAAYDPLTKFATFEFWKSIAIAWSYMWLVLPAGLIFTPLQWRPVIFRLLAWATLGTCVALVMAADTERMVSYLSPIVFIATGFLVDRARSRIFDVMLVLSAAAHFFVMLATVVFPVQPHGLFTASLRLELVIAACVVAAVMITPLIRERRNLVAGEL